MNSNVNTAAVTLLQQTDYDRAAHLLGRAFLQDPLLRHFFHGSEQELVEFLTQLNQVFLKYSQPYNHLYTTEGIKGIALWLPPGATTTDEWRLFRLGFYKVFFKLSWNRWWEFLTAFHTIETLHHQEAPEPHWYLYLLGIAPEHQGQGVGRLLLQPVLQQADRDRMPCYLYTTTEGGVRFYQRQGFEILRHESPGKTVPPIWTMKRLPRA